MSGLVDFESPGSLDDFARLAGFDLRQFFAVALQQVRQFQQHVATNRRCDLGPVFEAAVGRLHRRIDIDWISVGDAGDNLAGSWIDHLQRLTGMALNVAAVNKQRMASTEEGFNLRQQRNIAHGVFLVANKEKPEVIR
ncbi:hypothetical protein D3C87_1685900 [compost metagenome]